MQLVSNHLQHSLAFKMEY